MSETDMGLALMRLLGFILSLIVVFLVIKHAVLSALRSHETEIRERALEKLRMPEVTVYRFKVTGKDRATGMDTTDYFMAADAQDARSRADAHGVIVGSVTHER